MATNQPPAYENPPAYERGATNRVKKHYLSCTRPGNTKAVNPYAKKRIGTSTIRDWIASNGGTTVAKGPWWMHDCEDSWEVFKSSQDQTAKLTSGRVESLGLVEWLRSLPRQLVKEEAASILAVNGMPLQLDEIEYTITQPSYTTNKGHGDWTRKWGWMVEFEAHTYPQHLRCSCWRMRCQICLEDLPSLLNAGDISWKDAAVDRGQMCYNKDTNQSRRWDWGCSSRFSPAPTSPQNWEARVGGRSRHRSVLRDFRTRLSPETIYKARIYQRTGAGKYKIVMVYHFDTVYGNDLSWQRVDVWRYDLAEKLVQFMRQLLPQGPYPALVHD